MSAGNLNPLRQPVRFGEFEADFHSGELRKNGRIINIQNQPLTVLRILIERRGEIVGREDLRKALWTDGVYVDFDKNLSTAVNKVRQALGESRSGRARYIETVPRKGYRFRAAIEQVGPAEAKLLPFPVEISTEMPPPPIKINRRLALIVSAGLAVSLAIVAGWYLRSSKVKPAEIIQTQLTENSSEADVMDAAISPDGKSLAYADATGFYLKIIQSGEIHALPDLESARISRISWFPDNVHLLAKAVSTDDSSSNLWTVSVFGGAPRLFRKDVSQASISSDGAEIAFVTSAQDAIWSIQADGEKASKIAGAEDGHRVGNPVWYPNRRRIAYSSMSPRDSTISLESFDLNTGQSVKFASFPTPSGGGRSLESFCVLPDGRVIYALGNTLWEIETDPRTGRSTTAARQIGQWNDVDFLDGLHVSADGRRLVLLKGVLGHTVFVADLEDGGKRLRDLRRLTLVGRSNYAHAWTPDSHAVVFESFHEGHHEIFKQQIDQRITEPLVTGKENAIAGHFSPDGKWLLYLLGPIGVAQKLMRMPVSGGLPELVLNIPNLGNYYCTRVPVNLCVAAVREEKQLVFYAFDPEKAPPGGIPHNELREVARTDYEPSDWGLSPDGAAIAMVRPGDQEGRIRILPLSSRAQHTTQGVRDVFVAGRSGFVTLNWAADGKGWYVANPSVLGEAHFLYIDLVGRATILKSPESVLPPWGVPSPDGRHLAIMNSAVSRNAWLIENF